MLRFLVASLLVASCAQSQAPANLDVALKPIKDIDPNLKKARLEGLSAAIVPEIEWRSFFKAPPTSKQMPVLQQKLAAWRESDDPKSLLDRARKESVLGLVSKAEASYRSLLRRVPKHSEAMLELAQLYLRRRQTEASFDILAEVKQLIDAAERPDRSFIFRYKYTLALAYLARDERVAGHKILTELIAVDPEFSPGYAALAQSYLVLGRITAASFIAKRGLDLGGENAILLNLMGSCHLAQGQQTEARRFFDDALALNPELPEALANRARMAMERREFTAAEADLERALKVAPAQVEALILLGSVQRRMGANTAAKQSLLRALELNPESAYARYNLALLSLSQDKDAATALRLFHEVLQTKDDAAGIKDLAKAQISTLGERWTLDSATAADTPQ